MTAALDFADIAVGLIAGVIGALSGALGVWVLVRREKRDTTKAADAEADRLIALKDETIGELAGRIERLEEAERQRVLRDEARDAEVAGLRAEVKDLREAVDDRNNIIAEFGCRNACANRVPFWGAKDPAI